MNTLNLLRAIGLALAILWGWEAIKLIQSNGDTFSILFKTALSGFTFYSFIKSFKK